MNHDILNSCTIIVIEAFTYMVVVCLIRNATLLLQAAEAQKITIKSRTASAVKTVIHCFQTPIALNLACY
jgi:hypothetical protein